MAEFDETVPCGDETSLPQEVYDLQSVYARINHEDTLTFDSCDTERTSREEKDKKDNFDTHKAIVSLHIRSTGNESVNEKVSNETVFEDDAAEQKGYELRIKEESTPRKKHSSSKRSFSTGTDIKETPVSQSSKKQDKLCSSFPMSVKHLESHGANGKERKTRRKHASAEGVVSQTERSKRRNAVDPSVRQDEREKSTVPKCANSDTRTTSFRRYSQAERTQAALDNEERNTEHRLYTDEAYASKENDKLKRQNTCLSNQEKETDMIGDRRRNRNGTQSVSFARKAWETSIGNDSTTLFDQSSSKRHLTRCETAPVKLPSQNASVKSAPEKATFQEGLASDSYYLVCSVCKKNERNTHASSYCLNCAYYLCARCLRHHERDSTKKDHNIFKGNKMPGSFTVKRFEVQRKMNEKCSQHTNRNIKCFCTDHNSLCCTVCKATDHAICTMQSLDDLLIQTTDIRKLKHQTSETSKQRLNTMRRINNALKLNAELSDKERDAIIEEVKNKSLAMVEHIKSLENEFIKQVNNTFDEDRSELQKERGECEKFISVLSKDIQYLNEPKAVKESELKTIERLKQIETAKPSECIEQYLASDGVIERKPTKFILNSELFSKITTAISIGELVPWVSEESKLSRTNDTELSSCTAEDDVIEGKRITEYRIFPGWTEGDFASTTGFTAIQLLDDGTFLLADHKNWKIKWFDYELSFLKSVEVSSEPWGMARRCKDKYIVTLPVEYSYQEIDITGGELILCRKIHLGIEGTCVLLIESKLLFAGIDVEKPTLILTDLDGKSHEPLLSKDKLKLFKRPNHLLGLSSNPNIILISDVDKGVFAISMDKREILFHYTDRTFRCAMGMTKVENNGQIFICSQQTHSLHCISNDGQYLFTVPMENIQDMRKPQCICYLPHLDEFLVTFDKNYSFAKFKLA